MPSIKNKSLLLHNQITSAIKEFDARNTVVATAQKTQNASNKDKQTEIAKDLKFLINQSYRLDELKKNIKQFEKNQNTFDRKFTSAAPDLINERISTLAKELETHTSQCSNYTMTTPDMVNIRVDALETALATLSQQ